VPPRESGASGRIRFSDFGGRRFLLLVFSDVANGMLFWGITLWIPLVIESLGFTGGSRGLLAALPYMLSLFLTVPMMAISDRTGKRVRIASSGLLVGGAFVGLLPLVGSPVATLLMICVGMGYFTAAYTSNLWAIAVTDLPPHLVGPATGIINGVGAGRQAASSPGSSSGSCARRRAHTCQASSCSRGGDTRRAGAAALRAVALEPGGLAHRRRGGPGRMTRRPEAPIRPRPPCGILILLTSLSLQDDNPDPAGGSTVTQFATMPVRPQSFAVRGRRAVRVHLRTRSPAQVDALIRRPQPTIPPAQGDAQ